MKSCAGKMRHRITIESRSQAADGLGGFTETWATHATVWANIKPASGSERFFAEKLEENITHKIRVRYLSTIESEMRVSYESRIFKILSVINEDERDRYMVLNCVEGAGN